MLARNSRLTVENGERKREAIPTELVDLGGGPALTAGFGCLKSTWMDIENRDTDLFGSGKRGRPQSMCSVSDKPRMLHQWYRSTVAILRNLHQWVLKQFTIWRQSKKLDFYHRRVVPSKVQIGLKKKQFEGRIEAAGLRQSTVGPQTRCWKACTLFLFWA